MSAFHSHFVTELFRRFDVASDSLARVLDVLDGSIIFRHRAADFGDGLADFPADTIVRSIGVIFALDIVAPKLLLCLRREK